MSPNEAIKRQKHLETVGSESLQVKLSGDLLERVEAISEEMDVAPDEIIRLAVQRVVGGMAPELEKELKGYISATGIGGVGTNLNPSLIDKHYQRGPNGRGEVIL